MSQQLQKSLNLKMKQFLQHQQHQHQNLQTNQYILRFMFLEYHPPTKKGREISGLVEGAKGAVKSGMGNYLDF